MQKFGRIIPALCVLGLTACTVDLTDQQPETPAPQCSLLTSAERTDLKAAMASSVTGSNEIQTYSEFWNTNARILEFAAQATPGTYLWNGDSWAYQATSPTAIFLVGSIRIEMSASNGLNEGIAKFISLHNDAQLCSGTPICDEGDWTLYAEASTETISVRLDSWKETAWSYSVTSAGELAYVAMSVPGGEQRIITPHEDPYAADTTWELRFVGPNGMFQQQKSTHPNGGFTVKYADRSLTIDNYLSCGQPLTDDLWIYFPNVSELLHIRDLGRLISTSLELHPLE